MTVTNATQKNPWRRGMPSLSAVDTFATIINTTTKPVTVDGTTAVWPNGGDLLALKFFGTGNSNDTFDAKVYGWSSLYDTLGSTVLWCPTLLMTLSLTLSTSVGVASSAQVATERDADTVTAGTGALPSTRYTLFSPANDTPALVTLEPIGFELVSVGFDLTGATGAGVAYRFV